MDQRFAWSGRARHTLLDGPLFLSLNTPYSQEDLEALPIKYTQNSGCGHRGAVNSGLRGAQEVRIGTPRAAGGGCTLAPRLGAARAKGQEQSAQD